MFCIIGLCWIVLVVPLQWLPLRLPLPQVHVMLQRTLRFPDRGEALLMVKLGTFTFGIQRQMSLNMRGLHSRRPHQSLQCLVLLSKFNNLLKDSDAAIVLRMMISMPEAAMEGQNLSLDQGASRFAFHSYSNFVSCMVMWCAQC